MAWPVPPQYLYSGTAVDPGELGLDIFEMAREVNGYIDRDNVRDSAITSAKVATGTFNTVGTTEATGTWAVPMATLGSGETGAWTEVTPLTTSVTTDDGRLVADAFVNYTTLAGMVAAHQDVLEFRLLIDGLPVDATGWFSGLRFRSVAYLVGSAPVDAGTHSIVVQWRGYGKVWENAASIAAGSVSATTAGIKPATVNSYELMNGVVVWRHQKR